MRRFVEHQFIDDEFFERRDAGMHLLTLIRSKSYFDVEDMLTWRLNERVSTIEPFADTIFAIADALISELKAPRVPQRYRDLGGAMKLLKRLYETTAGPEQNSIRRYCLDALDGLLEAHPPLGWSLVDDLTPS